MLLLSPSYFSFQLDACQNRWINGAETNIRGHVFTCLFPSLTFMNINILISFSWVSVQIFCFKKRLLSPYFKNKYWSLFPLWKEHTVMLIFKSSCFFWKTLPKCGYGVLLPGSLSLFSAVGNLQLYYCSLSFQFDVICLKSTSMMCKNWGH